MKPTTPLLPGTLAVLLVLSAGSTLAQSGGSAQSARSHVLRLTDGRVLRVKARETTDGWEVRSGREWVSLPDTLVASGQPESTLLAEARRLERSIDAADSVRRSAYAEWLGSQGLQVEALRELDRILTLDPEQPDARRVLISLDLPVDLPGLERADDPVALERFFDAAAGSTPAVREIAAQRLAERGEIDGLQEELLALLVDRSPKRRAFAAQLLGRLVPGRHVEALLGRAILDVSEPVRTQAALALGHAPEEAVVAPAVGALRSKHDVVRLHAARALGTMGHASAVAPLVAHLSSLQGSDRSGAPRSHIFVGRQTAYVQDYDVEVSQNSAIADPVINVLAEGDVLEAAVLGVQEHVVATERASTRRSLARLTGADPGHTTEAWMRWWKENHDAWTTRPRNATASEPDSRDR